MSPLRTSGGGSGDFDYELPDEGVHAARCIRIIDIGTQEVTYHKTGETKEQHKVWIFWELVEHRHREWTWEGEQRSAPFLVGRKFTLSHHENAHLRKVMESWHNQKFNDDALDDVGGFDLTELMGKAASVQVVHSDDGKWAEVNAVLPGDEDAVGQPESEPLLLILTPEEFNPEVYGELSDRMQENVRSSKEWPEIRARFYTEHESQAGSANSGPAPQGGGAHDERNPPPPSDGDAPDDDVPF